MYYLLRPLCCFIFFSIFSFANAQDSKKVKTSIEEISEACENKPLKDRVRVSVTNFDVTTGGAPSTLSDNMTSMLTNALQQTNCFRVLESLSKQRDMTGEIDFGESEYAGGTTPEKGKMLGAQVIATGEVTEFSRKTKSGNVTFVKTSKEVVKLGFIIKLINPVTRDLLWSKSINVEGKSGGGGKLGTTLPLIGDLNAGSGDVKDEAVANALEQGILQAAELIVDQVDEVELPSVEDLTVTETVLTIPDIDFMSLRRLEERVSSLSEVNDVSKSLQDGTGVLRVNHKLTTEEFIDILFEVVSSEYDITEAKGDDISLAAK